MAVFFSWGVSVLRCAGSHVNSPCSHQPLHSARKFSGPYFSLVNHRYVGQVRSDIAEQLSRTPRFRFSSITVRVLTLRSGFLTHNAFVVVSPPHVVGYANGIAQSIVSFSRFLGPILGGTVSCPTGFRRTRTHDPPAVVHQR